MWPLFMFVHLTKRTKFLVRVCLFNKRTNTNNRRTVHELFAECLVRLQLYKLGLNALLSANYKDHS
ncbi:hypothetical protein Hanom_Chr10g00963411 [Helianthus anomalus]